MHDDRILLVERLLQWACSLRCVFGLSVFLNFKILKICEFHHLIAYSDYLAEFLLLNRAFSRNKLMSKNSQRYVTLNPFDINHGK